MIHVVDFEKTAFSTPFRGVLPPSGPQISAESGSATHCLAPGKPGWPPTSNWPLFSRPTPHAPRLTLHAPPAGLGQTQTLPRWLLTARHRQPNWQRPNGADLDERSFYIQYVTETDDSCRKINPFLPTRSLPSDR